jgi:hypothetical protein
MARSAKGMLTWGLAGMRVASCKKHARFGQHVGHYVPGLLEPASLPFEHTTPPRKLCAFPRGPPQSMRRKFFTFASLTRIEAYGRDMERRV